MRFDTDEWLRDIITGLLTGTAGGAIGSLILPGAGLFIGTAAGCITGLVSGELIYPIKWAWGADELTPNERLRGTVSSTESKPPSEERRQLESRSQGPIATFTPSKSMEREPR